MISNTRNFQRYSTHRLKRARRLYLYLAFESIMNAPDPNTIIAWCAHRMVVSGLYHHSMGRRDACWTLLRALFRLDRATNPYHSLFQSRSYTDSPFDRWRKFHGIVHMTNTQCKFEVSRYTNQQHHQQRIAA